MPAVKTRKIVLHPRTREKLKGLARECKDADTRTRYLIVIRSSEQWSGKRICKALGCCVSTVSRTLDRYEAFGEAGLVDRREDNGQTKAGEWYVGGGALDSTGHATGLFSPPADVDAGSAD